MSKKRKAFSLVELVVIVLVVAAFAYVAVPRLQFGAVNGAQADTVASKIVTDLRRTGAMAVSDAANNSGGYALNMNGSNYQIVNLNTSAVVDTGTIPGTVSCSGGTSFRFGPLGNLLSGSDTQLTITSSGKTFTITIVSATGAVKCTTN